MLAVILQILGACALVVAAWCVAPALAILVAGCALLVFGVLEELD